MDKSYRPWLPYQSFLLPPSPIDWLPEGHLVPFLLDVVATLDLSEIEFAIQRKDPRGTRPYDPRMMTALLLYGYCVGMPSSRKLEAGTHTDIALRVLSGDCHPDHSSIADFRRQNLPALGRLFVQVLRLCQAAGLVKLGHVALDGTKVQANASKHKAMSYARMLKTESDLEDEVKQLLSKAERTDEEEDTRFGHGKRGDELPEELRRRESRLRKIGEARAALEAEAALAKARRLQEQAEHAREKADTAADEARPRAEDVAREAETRFRDAEQTAMRKAEAALERMHVEAEAKRSSATTPAERRSATLAEQAEQRAEQTLADVTHIGTEVDTAIPGHQVPTETNGDPKPGAQRNFTDPDSRIMKRGSDFIQGYNGQAAVDEAHQVIVASPTLASAIRHRMRAIFRRCSRRSN